MLHRKTYIGVFRDLQDEALATAKEHGFTDATPGEDIALMHSELSEALEDIRAGKHLNSTTYRDADGKPEGVPSEMADTVIRILHFCAKHDIALGHAICEKMAFNKSRPHKHGKVL
jgi:NTP pyrophosphatase (non-canonical NTP hydrolase)